jgi:hypothetical protein
MAQAVHSDDPRFLKMKTAARHFAYYNFCRVHSSLRVTPAMEAGITDHVWNLEALIGAGLQ